jgi:predicted Rossmann fold flavoprotein
MVAVVGAGPAGLMAAYAAASDGAGVILFDRNPEPGRKLLLTGGGRCNVTHEGEWSEMTAAFFGDGRFLYPAFRALSNRDTIAWFESRGVPLIREDTGKVFPRSDRASDVRDALLEACIEAGVEVRTGGIAGSSRTRTDFRLVTGSYRLGGHCGVLATVDCHIRDRSDGDGLRWRPNWAYRLFRHDRHWLP